MHCNLFNLVGSDEDYILVCRRFYYDLQCNFGEPIG